MDQEEKNALLDILRLKTGTIDKFGLESSSNAYLKTVGSPTTGLEDVTWAAASGGKLTLSTPVTFDMGANNAGVVYSVHLMSSSVSTTFNENVAQINTDIGGLSNYDIYRIDGIELTIED